MAQVTMYSSMMCGFCYRAKQLLKKKGVEWEEIDVLFHPSRKQEMMQRANGKHTVPQIFINGEHVGGCDELYALDKAGKLDPMLAQPSS